MSQARVLPEPSFVQHAPFCLRCGYNLEGLAPPNACPECGLWFEAGTLIVAGIPRHMTKNTSPIRRLVWGAMLVLSGAFYFSWTFVVFRHPWVALAWALTIVGCLVWLLSTSQRERKAYERFAFTRDGIARLPYTMKAGETNIDTVFVAWEDADSFVIQRVGPFWKRLIVGKRGAKGEVVESVFDAGFRCSDEHAMTVRDAMERAMLAQREGPLGGSARSSASPTLHSPMLHSPMLHSPPLPEPLAPEFVVLGTEFLASLGAVPHFSAHMVFNERGAVVFPANQAHSSVKAEGISYEDNYAGDALAAVLSPGRIDVQWHQAYPDARVVAIVSRMLALPEFALLRGCGVTYQGNPLALAGVV